METSYLDDFRVIGKLETSVKEIVELNGKLGMIFSSLGDLPVNVNMAILIKKELYNILVESLDFDYNNSGDTRAIVKSIRDKIKDFKTKDDNIEISLNSVELFEALRITKYYHATLSLALSYRKESAAIIFNEENLKKDVLDSLDN